MDNGTFFYWGTLVTSFVLIAFILTLRQMFQNHLAEREEAQKRRQEVIEVAESNSGL